MTEQKDCCGSTSCGQTCKLIAIAGVALLVYIFLSDWVIHGLILKPTYMATASLWRPEVEMQQGFFFVMLAGQALIALAMTLIFSKGYEGRGLLEGVRFGLYFSMVGAANNLIFYAVQPLPCALVGAWIGLGTVQSVGGGTLLALIFGRCYGTCCREEGDKKRGCCSHESSKQ